MKTSVRQIQAFVTIAAQQSFSQAANILGVTQPSLSLLIKELERVLCVTLFDRNTRGVYLSQAGKDLLPTAQRILSDFQRLEESAEDLSRLARGEVRVACSTVLAANILPLALRQFEADFPGIRVMICDTAEQTLPDLVRNDQVDFAIATQVEADPRLHQELILSDHMAVYFAPDHPLAIHDTVTWRQLGNTPLALLDRSSPLRQIVDRTAGRLGIWLNVRYEVTFGNTALALTEQGLAATILPPNALRTPDTFNCQRRILTKPVAERKMMLIRLANRTPAPAVQTFWDYCRNEVQTVASVG